MPILGRRARRGPHDLAGPGWNTAGSIALRPIGTVRNGERRMRSNGWERVESRIEVEPALAEALRGLEGFSHLIVLTWLHLAAEEPREHLAIHPGGDERLPLIGVFALRVAGRPNPIGCSVVRLLGVEGGVLRVRGLDAIDGTPVLDLKPYLPPYDSVPEALLPDWSSPSSP
jgi:tRNA-Thr(GGU) m(6)t(6)A37 methyltransferase TsaA